MLPMMHLLYIKCSVAIAGLNKLETQATNPDIAELDILYIKCSGAIAGLNKLEIQATNPDIAELANIFYTIFNLYYWGFVGLDSKSP